MIGCSAVLTGTFSSCANAVLKNENEDINQRKLAHFDKNTRIMSQQEEMTTDINIEHAALVALACQGGAAQGAAKAVAAANAAERADATAHEREMAAAASIEAAFTVEIYAACIAVELERAESSHVRDNDLDACINAASDAKISSAQARNAISRAARSLVLAAGHDTDAAAARVLSLVASSSSTDERRRPRDDHAECEGWLDQN
jgi:hypothetical protein